MSNLVYPYLFERIAVAKPWAGARLPMLFPSVANDFPAGTGESIEVADLPGASTLVRSGAARGMNLRQLVGKHSTPILGHLAQGQADFPIALKFIDTAEPLSIQVHPRDELNSSGTLQTRGKTEAWLILDAAPGAVIYQGLKPGLTRQHFERALSAGMPQETLNAVHVTRGDFLLNPAGTIHALGAGLTLLEIQQNCGVTLRFFDWPELGRKSRELQVAQAFEAADFSATRPAVVKVAGGEGVQTLQLAAPFGVQSLRKSKAARHLKDWPGFTLFTCLEGAFELIIHGEGELHTCEMRPSDSLLVPAVFNDFEVHPRSSCWLIESYAM